MAKLKPISRTAFSGSRPIQEVSNAAARDIETCLMNLIKPQALKL